MGWHKGLKLFGEKGEEVVEKELRQIHMEGFQLKHWYELTKEERTKALRYLMYLKEKRDGRIKGRGCADGRSQQKYTEKIDTSLPAASLATIMLKCMITAFKRRDFTAVDIPGSVLQTKMPKREEDVHAYYMVVWWNFWLNWYPKPTRIRVPETQTGIHLLQSECCRLWDFKGSPFVLEELAH